MKPRLLRVGAAAIAALAAVIWALQGGGPPDPLSTQPRAEATPMVTPMAASAAVEEPASVSDEPAAGFYTYAIPIVELAGLSPDAAPGTRLDLWIAWQPKGSDQPDVRPLLKGVVLEQVVPPTLPEGPYAAILQVPMRSARRLIWGDMFGSLSVMEPNQASTTGT